VSREIPDSLRLRERLVDATWVECHADALVCGLVFDLCATRDQRLTTGRGR